MQIDANQRKTVMQAVFLDVEHILKALLEKVVERELGRNVLLLQKLGMNHDRAELLEHRAVMQADDSAVRKSHMIPAPKVPEKFLAGGCLVAGHGGAGSVDAA